MEFNPLETGNHVVIQGYGDGGFRIGGSFISGPVLVWRDKAVETEDLPVPDIRPGHLHAALGGEAAVEILLIGCGSEGRVLTGEQQKLFRDVGISAEAMDTGAACRTFNVLQGEGRLVAAWLVPVV